ncbi:type II toxin-antitoxin system VapC family toxin [Aromatoleum toluolicum]|uniref:Ribonuclease VapC n=1 Tax=Aromatoleum toluolicum TaxID=90060 RepID=A0ABX1NM32_9RHOO|nr:type II toxin-antitoxin system VapC family toxin [Aromatoleum toluolicum]NMG00390.1 type II toxin-antitoxin system VapC family toxin [Aromatoleum toluolicum]
MILIDTNVLSALMQQQPDERVVAWLDEQPAESVWISSVTLFEARYGLALLAPGRRRAALQERFDLLVREDLENRVLLFDASAAAYAAELAAERRNAGRPVDMRDTFIAGIALSRRATLATRNTRHFDDLSVPVVNPWGDHA